MAFPPGDVTVVDSFDRADGAVYAGAGSTTWDTVFNAGDASGMVVSGNAMTVAHNDDGGSTLESLNDFIRIFTLAATSGGYVAFGWRLQGKGTSAWTSYGFVAQGPTWTLRRYETDRSVTTLVTFDSESSPGAGNKFGIYAHGDTHEVWLFQAGSWGSAPIITYTDTDSRKISAAGACWFELSNASWKIDDYSSGSLTAPTTGVTIYVDPDNSAASDSYSRTQASNPATPFLTLNAACNVARADTTWHDTILVKRSTLGHAWPGGIDPNMQPQLDHRFTNRADAAPGWLFGLNDGNQTIVVKGEITLTSRADVVAAGGTGALPKLHRMMWRGLTNWQFEGFQVGYNVSSDAARIAGTGHDFSTLGAWERSTDITIKHCYFTGGAGITYWWAGDFRLEQNVIHSPLPPDGGNPGFHDGAGLRTERLPNDDLGGTSVGNLYVLDNEFSNVRGDDACTFGGTLPTDPQWTSQSFEVGNNLFKDCTEGANPNFHTDAIQVLSCNNVNIHGNIFIGNSDAVICSDGENGVVEFSNNLVVGGGSQVQIQGCQTLIIRHNTLFPTSPDKTASIMFYTRAVLSQPTLLTMENNVIGGVYFRDHDWSTMFRSGSVVRKNAAITQAGQNTPWGAHLSGIPEFGHSTRLDVIPNDTVLQGVLPRNWELANSPTPGPGIGQGVASDITADVFGRAYTSPPDVGALQSSGTAVTPIDRPPYVTSLSPGDNAVDVASNTLVVAILYPRPGTTIDPATISTDSFYVVDPHNVQLPAVVTLDEPSGTLVLDISGVLYPYVVYQARLTTAIKDTHGSALDSQVFWSFRVIGSYPAPAVLTSGDGGGGGTTVTRVQCPISVQDISGNVESSVSVEIRNRITGLPATLFTSETGSGTVSNPLPTDSTGAVPIWVTPGKYNIIVHASPDYTRAWDAAEGGSAVGPAGPAGPVGGGGGTTYYVSNSGSNSNDGQTSGSAWQTVAKVNSTTLSPGDQVLFASGQTFSDAALVPPNSGTDGAPIHFGTYGTAGNAVLSKGIGYLDRHWLVFESLTVTGAGAGVLPFQGGNNSGHYSNHITIRRCLFDNGATSSTGVVGIVVYGDDVTIENNTVQNTGDNGMYLVGDGYRVNRNLIQNTGLNTTIGSARHGIYSLASNAEYIANTIYNSSTDGLSIRYRNTIARGNKIIGCQIGIAWFQIDTVAGVSEWTDNYIASYSVAGIYVSPSDTGGNTVESFVIARNTIAFVFGAVGMDLNPLSGNGTYYLGGVGQNLIGNPSAEVDATGWVTTGGPLASGATLTRVARTVAFPATPPKFASDGGSNEFKVVTTAVASEGAAVTFTSLPKGNYVFVAWVRGNAGGETVTATGGTGGTGNKSRNYTLGTGYTQVVLPFSVQDSGSVYVGILTQSATIRTFFFDTAQILAVN
jgi:Bacterial Ig-like domain/Right handed beta helix region